MTHSKYLKGGKSQTRILYPAKLSFKDVGKMKTFPGKQRWREFIDNRLALQEILEEVLQAERK